MNPSEIKFGVQTMDFLYMSVKEMENLSDHLLVASRWDQIDMAAN